MILEKDRRGIKLFAKHLRPDVFKHLIPRQTDRFRDRHLFRGFQVAHSDLPTGVLHDFSCAVAGPPLRPGREAQCHPIAADFTAE